MVTTDLPLATLALLKQLSTSVPAWSVEGPTCATGPCTFGGLSQETDGEGKRKRIQIVEQVDSVLIRARHVDGRALVALWVRRPGLEPKPRGKPWERALYGGRTRKIKKRIYTLPSLLALLPERAVPLFALDLLAQIGPRAWDLDMAWRGRHPSEHAPRPLTATALRAYIAAPDHAAALVAVAEQGKKEVAA
jgi:hypothetical protein